MTLQQLLTFTAAHEPSDVRCAMAAVLARERPRGAETYRRFYRAVCLRLTAGRHRHAPARLALPSGSVGSYASGQPPAAQHDTLGHARMLASGSLTRQK